MGIYCQLKKICLHSFNLRISIDLIHTVPETPSHLFRYQVIQDFATAKIIIDVYMMTAYHSTNTLNDTGP